MGITLKPRFKTKKVFHLISNVLSLLENSWKMVVHCRITTFRRSQHYTWCSVCAVECRHCKDMYRTHIAFPWTCKSNLLFESIRQTHSILCQDYNILRSWNCARRAQGLHWITR